MRRSPRRPRTDPPPGPRAPDPAAPAGRLSGVRVVSYDDDGRPSREDMSYGETIFNRGAVRLPRFLTGRRSSPRR